jgi:hypothetical protein
MLQSVDMKNDVWAEDEALRDSKEYTHEAQTDGGTDCRHWSVDVC